MGISELQCRVGQKDRVLYFYLFLSATSFFDNLQLLPI